MPRLWCVSTPISGQRENLWSALADWLSRMGLSVLAQIVLVQIVFGSYRFGSNRISSNRNVMSLRVMSLTRDPQSVECSLLCRDKHHSRRWEEGGGGIGSSCLWSRAVVVCLASICRPYYRSRDGLRSGLVRLFPGTVLRYVGRGTVKKRRLPPPNRRPSIFSQGAGCDPQ